MADLRGTVGIITKPLGSGGVTPVSNLVEILTSVSESVFIVTANEGVNLNPGRNDRLVVNSFRYEYGKTTLEKIANNFLLQVKIALSIFRRRKSITTWVFFLDSHVFILPVFVAKILRSKIIFPLAASIKGSAKAQNNWLNNLLLVFESITFDLADCIILYSGNLISDWGLSRYNNKIRIGREHFLDFNAFTVTTPISSRPPLIGYIGRLSGEKGVQHFAQALPTILDDRQDLRVLIGGDGQLKESIEASLQEEGLTARVDLPGWISHDDLPRYLNQFRLLVLPSYSEGLPNIMLEAMACGTPVLATPVGAIPDVIIDGKTGFIMENNSPECIAENVKRALDSPDLERIAENGRRFVEENFTFEKTVENWKEILQSTE
jgi:glycosyltransferase involved in cell wall biosynthesis